MSAAPEAEDIVIFGGTFDPIHHGHLIAARTIAERRDLRRITLMPASRPPHKSEARAASHHRLAMLREVCMQDERLAVSDIELGREGPSYSIDTVQRLLARDNVASVTLIIGADMLEDLPDWHRADELARMAEFLVACRPPWDTRMVDILSTITGRMGGDVGERLARSVVETPRIDISSSDIRRRLASGRSVRYLVPEVVRAYIRSNGLYREP